MTEKDRTEKIWQQADGERQDRNRIEKDGQQADRERQDRKIRAAG